MRKFFTLLWLLFPVAVIYYHFNQGQTQMAREKARRHVAEIRALERAKEPNWESIVEEYDKVAAELPKDDPLRQVAMTASFLRASLFTSVVAFGVAAMAVLLGILFVLAGVACLVAAAGVMRCSEGRPCPEES